MRHDKVSRIEDTRPAPVKMRAPDGGIFDIRRSQRGGPSIADLVARGWTLIASEEVSNG